MEDPINHYNRCWANDLEVVQKVVCSTCQSEVVVFMQNQQMRNKRRGLKRKHEKEGNDKL